MRTNYYTITTRLRMNRKKKKYFESFIEDYNKVYRIMWRLRMSRDFLERFENESKFATFITIQYGFDSSTINSILNDINTHRKRLRELKKTELIQFKYKIKSLEDKIDRIKGKINKLKQKAACNEATEIELREYRKLKNHLYLYQNDLNRVKQNCNNTQHCLHNNILKYAFGGKKLFKAQYDLKKNGYRDHNEWYKDYTNHRDKNIFYLGKVKDKCGNHRFQMQCFYVLDCFSVKIRKESVYCESQSIEDKYIFFSEINFNHLHKELVKIVSSYNNSSVGIVPLNYRIIRKGKKWYLQCIFKIEYSDNEIETTSNDGVIGLDYNNGFIVASETDSQGNLIDLARYDLKFHGKGNRGDTELQQTLATIVNLAKNKGKDIVIEDLDFKKKKSQMCKTFSSKGKKYNRMLALFDYGRYKSRMYNCCHRNKVMLHLVSPAYTSRIGMQKYNNSKKMSTHQSASYVIARRGQGYIDKLVA